MLDDGDRTTQQRINSNNIIAPNWKKWKHVDEIEGSREKKKEQNKHKTVRENAKMKMMMKNIYIYMGKRAKTKFAQQFLRCLISCLYINVGDGNASELLISFPFSPFFAALAREKKEANIERRIIFFRAQITEYNS